jgi:hypothetical protein
VYARKSPRVKKSFLGNFRIASMTLGAFAGGNSCGEALPRDFRYSNYRFKPSMVIHEKEKSNR